MITHINQDQPQIVMSKGFAIMICADPWSNGSAKLELAIYYGEPNRISRLKISGGVTLDLGSVRADRSQLGLSIQLVLCCVLIGSVQSLRD